MIKEKKKCLLKINRQINISKKTVALMFVIILVIVSATLAFAEKRSIYVGDLIQIRINTQDYSTEQLKEKFSEFEIVNIEEKQDGCFLTIRTFETGEKRIQLDNKEIIIEVKSILEESENTGIIEGGLDIEKSKFYIKWNYVFCLLLTLFLLTGGITLYKYFKNRKVSLKTPYELFKYNVEAVLENEDFYFVRLTSCFKEYIELEHSCTIKGKTSSEIINEIKPIQRISTSLPQINSWLIECDRFKFSGIIASSEQKNSLKQNLIELVTELNNTKEVEL